MKCFILSILLAALPLAGLTMGNYAGWSSRAAITLPFKTQLGLAQAALPGELLNIANPDLSDLRIFTATGEDVSYQVHLAAESKIDVPLDARIINRSYIAGVSSSLTLNFLNQHVVKNRLILLTGGEDFCRRVRLEGSDDGLHWQTIRDGALIYSLINNPSETVEQQEVSFPDNTQQYLRVIVRNDENDKGRVEIRDARCLRREIIPAQTATVPIISCTSLINYKDTVIDIDLGEKNQSLCKLTLQCADTAFFRQLSVFGRNTIISTLDLSVEENPDRMKMVEEPWTEITSGAIYRSPGETSTANDTLRIALNGAQYRYLQVRIANGDDAPLHDISPSVTRLLCFVEFVPHGEQNFSCYVGNQHALAPSYDLAHYIDQLRTQGISIATISNLSPNPYYLINKPVVPWSERVPLLRWLALALIFVTLATLVYRQLRIIRN